MLLDRLFRSAKSRPTSAPRPRRAAWLSVEALDDRIVPATLSVGDAAIVEGDAGTQFALVRVNLDAPSKHTVSVNYTTADGSANAGSDYGAVAGKVSFARGETTKTIAVPVYGDQVSESNESFVVTLSGAQRARIGDGQGAVTIVEDEPRIRIGDTSGTVVYSYGTIIGTTFYFQVGLGAAADDFVTVDYATADGTATAGVDYLATSGTVTFAPGETTQTIAVEVIGQDLGLPEWFYVDLSGASGNVPIIDGQGVGTIYLHVEQPGDPGDGCTPDHPYYPNC